MMKVRTVVAYGHHFETFLKGLDTKVQDKIFKIIEIVECLPRIPGKYFKSIKGSNGLYEVRIKLGSNLEGFLLHG